MRCQTNYKVCGSVHYKAVSVVRPRMRHYLTKETHPALYAEWHAEKNIGIIFESYAPQSHKKVWWQCNKNSGHTWLASFGHRARGHGCVYCTHQVCTIEESLKTVCPAVAKEWHPTKNETLQASDVFPRSTKKVWWKCLVDDRHEWRAQIAFRVTKERNIRSGCPYCSGRKFLREKSFEQTEPLLTTEWHPILNDENKPEHFSRCSKQKVWWLCKKNLAHYWRASISARVCLSTGCPFCARSKGEESVATILTAHNIAYVEQFTHDNCRGIRGHHLKFDFFIPGSNTCIEFDGSQHSHPKFGQKAFEDVKRNDATKNLFCDEVGIRLIRIQHTELEIEKYVLRELGISADEVLNVIIPYRRIRREEIPNGSG